MRRRRQGRSRTFPLLLVLALAAGAGWWAYDRSRPAEKPPLLTAPVAVRDIQEIVLATGTLRPSRLVAVGAQVSGRVTALKVAVGQKVARDDLIAEIDSLNQHNALRTVEARLESVRAQRLEKEASLAYALAALDRQKSTLAQRATSRDEFEKAEATVKTTRAQITALDAGIAEAEVAVEVARADIAYTRITAPIEGTVLAVVAQEGQTVNAAQTTPTIVVLGQLDTMRVEAEISEVDVDRVKPGLPVSFTVLGAKAKRYEAKLTAVDPAPESIVNDASLRSGSSSTTSSGSGSTSSAIYYNGVFTIPNPDGDLRTYMTANVRIVVAEAKAVPTIPASAVGERRPDGSFTVMVPGPGGDAEPRAVRIGLNDKVTAQVLSGLAPGDRVIVGGNTPPPAREMRRPRGPFGF